MYFPRNHGYIKEERVGGRPSPGEKHVGIYGDYQFKILLDELHNS